MGPKPRDYTYRPPKSVRKGALRAALSLRAREKSLVILNDFKLGEAKSKQAFEALTKRMKLKNALVVDVKENASAHRAIRNLASFDVLAPEGVNVESILRHKALVLTQSAARKLEGSLS
jgi:large subunit ribosomal protein L4